MQMCRLTKRKSLLNRQPRTEATPAPFPLHNNVNNQLCKTVNINLQFNTNGTASCLWTEALPLHELGQLQVTRASNVEFNNSSQHWEVKDRRGKVRFIAKSRAACLEWEQTNLQPE